jgi:hypothetical protein
MLLKILLQCTHTVKKMKMLYLMLIVLISSRIWRKKAANLLIGEVQQASKAL